MEVLKFSNLLQKKWISKLLGYNYTIFHRRGTDNTVADTLSRRHEENNVQVDQSEVFPQQRGHGCYEGGMIFYDANISISIVS